MEVAFVKVPPISVAAEWPLARPWLEGALVGAQGRYEPEDVLIELATGGMQLWLARLDGRSVAAYVTVILKFPRKKVLMVFLIGGSGMRHWFQTSVEVLEGFARNEGCAQIEGGFRKGWQRVWRGSHVSGVTISKDI